MRANFLFTIVFIACIANIFPQEEPRLKELKDNFQKKYFSVGFLFQFVGSFKSEAVSEANGFKVANLRLRVSGELDEKYGYLVWTNFAPSPKLLDAKMYYKFDGGITITFGQFKAPFSTEYLISESDIDFINRSQAASNLSLGRQIGVQLNGELANSSYKYVVGVFNGNGVNTTNNNKHLMYVGRFIFNPIDEKNSSLAIALNAGSVKNTVAAGQIETQNVFGGDFRWTMNQLFVSSEFISSQHDLLGAATTNNGFHVTGGYRVKQNMQVLLRYDTYKSGAAGATAENYFVLGYNVWPTGATAFQLNYIIDTNSSELKYHQILVNGQLAF